MKTLNIHMITNIKKLLKVKVFQISVLIFLSFITINFIGFVFKDITNKEYLNFYLMLIQQAMFVGMILWFFRSKILSPSTLLSKPNKLQKYIKAVFEGFCYLFVFGIVLSIVQQYITPYGFMTQENIFRLFPTHIVPKSIIIIVTCIIAPITEEYIFRGAILGNLMQSFTKLKAVLLSSVLFSLLHFQPEVAGAIFVISLIISSLYLKYETIYIPIAFHIVNNSLKTIISL